MSAILRKISISLSITLIFSGMAFAGNIGSYIYGIYSEIFTVGAVYSGSSEDRADIWDFNGQWGYPISTSNINPFDGNECTFSPSQAAWGITFAAEQDMSEYYNGTLEFYVRATSGDNIGNIRIGIKAGSYERYRYISDCDAAITTANGNWQKVVFHLNETFDGVITETNLKNISYLFLVSQDTNPNIYIDQIIWKKNSLLNVNIGNDEYGVFSETVPGASVNAVNFDRVRLRLSGSSAAMQTDGTAYEGNEYLRTGSAGWWAYEFVNTSTAVVSQDMSAYYNGSLEFYVRIAPEVTNYANITFGIEKSGWFFASNNNFGALGLQNNGEWQKVSIPLNALGFLNLTQNDLRTVTQLIRVTNGGNGSIDIDKITWNKYVEQAVNIGNDVYGVYSNTVDGASFYTSNADKVFKASWDWGGGDVQINTSAYEGTEYIQTGTAGGWGIHFADGSNALNPQNMSAYYNGALELYVRVSTASANYSNIKIGINTAALGEKSKTLAELGYVPNGQWQRISIPLNSAGFSGLTSAANLSSTNYLFVVQNYGSDRIDIDHVVWRKTASEARGNKDRQIYGVYSEWTGGVQFEVSGLDNVALWSWSGSGPVENNNDAASFEGYKYFSSLSGSGEWGIFFVNDAKNQEVSHSMSEFFNGTLEFFIKAAPGASIGSAAVGIKYGGSDNLKTLSSLGYQAGTGKWQKVSIPLNSSGFENLSQAVMLESVTGLFRVNNNGQSVDVDYIVWKKAGNPAPAASFSLNLKNRTDSSSAQKISWDADMIVNSSTKTAAANQYLELRLSDWFPGDASVDGWGMQIYTDNDSAEYKYTGEMSTDTASGLVSVRQGDSTYYLPMSWRVSDQLFPVPEPDDPSQRVFYDQWTEPWSDMRDITAGSSYYNRHEYIRFCDKRGYKWSTTQAYGSLGDSKTLRIYFLADFTGAKKNRVYKNDTITIELFYE